MSKDNNNKNNENWDFLCERCGKPITEDESNDYEGYCEHCYRIVQYEEINGLEDEE